MIAAERRFERESQKRRRELERLAKESAKLSAIEQARLEVETFENLLDVILSIHKEPCREWDWLSIASALRPPLPARLSTYEDGAQQRRMVSRPTGALEVHGTTTAARALDDDRHRELLVEYKKQIAEIESLRSLANRVLDGEGLAFLEAFAEFNPVAEFSSAGSLKRFAVERHDLIDCIFKVDANGTIPIEVTSLTATGKLSIKSMPRARRHEIYQDYVCGCAFRMAKEVFAMLPVDTIILTALADVSTGETASTNELPTLSVLVDRRGLAAINFDQVSPADAIDRFRLRCNFKTTRKAGSFKPIVPLTVEDLQVPRERNATLEQMLELVRELRNEIQIPRANASPIEEVSE